MSKELNQRFGNNWRKYRKECGLTQEEFAARLHISTPFYANVECGNKAMSMEVLYRLSRALDANLNSLFDDEENDTAAINDIVIMLNNAPKQDLEPVKNMVRCLLKELAKQRKSVKIQESGL